jgi:hypothetical protein
LLKFKTKGGSLFGAQPTEREEPAVEQARRVHRTNASSSTVGSIPEPSVVENVPAQIWQSIEQHVKGMGPTLVEEALAAEATAQVSPAPYERTAERQGYRNGLYRRDLVTRYGPIEDLRVPRVQTDRWQFAAGVSNLRLSERRTPPACVLHEFETRLLLTCHSTEEAFPAGWVLRRG